MPAAEPGRVLRWLTAATLLSAVLSLSLGSVALPPLAWLEVGLGGGTPLEQAIVGLRWPRVLTALTVGGALGLAGALMQTLLRNPLADPYILGVSGGASLAALACLAAGLGGLWPSLAAASGALLALLLVLWLARDGGAWDASRLLLTGVMVSAACGAGVQLLLSVAPQAGLSGMIHWLLGDLSAALHGATALPVLLAALLAALWLAPSLDVLAHGPLLAATLGVSIGQRRAQVAVLASLLAALAVALAGAIGFIGLVAPHLARRWGGAGHRVLLPAALLTGACLLSLADLLARLVIAPREIPAGVVTALLGVPLFLSGLRQRHG